MKAATFDYPKHRAKLHWGMVCVCLYVGLFGGVQVLGILDRAAVPDGEWRFDNGPFISLGFLSLIIIPLGLEGYYQKTGKLIGKRTAIILGVLAMAVSSAIQMSAPKFYVPYFNAKGWEFCYNEHLSSASVARGGRTVEIWYPKEKCPKKSAK